MSLKMPAYPNKIKFWIRYYSIHSIRSPKQIFIARQAFPCLFTLYFGIILNIMRELGVSEWLWDACNKFKPGNVCVVVCFINHAWFGMKHLPTNFPIHIHTCTRTNTHLFYECLAFDLTWCLLHMETDLFNLDGV